MKRLARLMLAIVLAAPCACMDSAGNRMTMQEWWESRFSQKKTDSLAEARNARRDEKASAEKGAAPDVADPVPLASDSRRPAAPLPEPHSAGPEAPPDAIRSEGLIVDDETIRVEDIMEPILSRLPAMAADLPPDVYWRKVGELARQHIIEAVAQHLIWRRAHQQMTDELKPQLEKAVDKMEKERINREFGGRETVYEKYLAKHGRTRDQVRERLRRSVLIDSYLRDRLLPMVPQPRKQELMDYYQAHADEFSQPARREMYLIEVPITAFLDLRKPVTHEDEQAATANARKAAQDAAEALKAGELFAGVARKYSYGLHKEDGGCWGFITAAAPGQTAPLQGRWEVPSRKLFELGPGDTSEVIEGVKCFFIVRVGRIETGKMQTFQEAQPDISNNLRQQRFMKLRADFLQKELDKSTIGSLDDFVRAVLNAVPSEPGSGTTAELPDSDVVPSRSPPLKTDAKKAARP